MHGDEFRWQRSPPHTTASPVPTSLPVAGTLTATATQGPDLLCVPPGSDASPRAWST